MPLVHPSAGVNYHGSMQLSRFTSSEGTLLGVLEQLLFKNVAVRVPVPAFPSHLPSAWPAVLRQFWGRRAGSLAFCAGSHRALCCCACPCEAVQQGWLLGALHTPQPPCHRLGGLPGLPLCLLLLTPEPKLFSVQVLSLLWALYDSSVWNI